MHDDQLSEAIIQPNSRMSDNSESVSGDGRVNWRNRDIKETEIHKSVQVGILIIDVKVAAKLLRFEYYKILVEW